MARTIPTLLAVMTPFPHWIDVHAGIAEARAMMRQHGVRHLPVSEEGRLLGVVTDRDLKRVQTPEEGAQPDDELSVGDAMVEQAYMVDVSESLDRVLDHMWEHRIGSTLVLRAGRLAGIFTAVDACRLFAERLREDDDRPDDDVA